MWVLHPIRVGAAISALVLFSRRFPYSVAALCSLHFMFIHFGTSLPGHALVNCLLLQSLFHSSKRRSFEDRSKVPGDPCRFRALCCCPFFESSGTNIGRRNMELRLKFDCAFVWTTEQPDDGSVRVCDVISYRLYSRGCARAYAFLMVIDWTSCRMDLWERYF